jgi:hypothetical protein
MATIRERRKADGTAVFHVQVADAPLSVMVCYDSPAATRIEGPTDVGAKADIFEVGG